MNLFRSVLVLLFVLPFTFLQAQTADEIVNQHIDAIGGKETINKIKSQVIYSELTILDTPLPNISTILIGKGFKSVTDLDGVGLVGQQVIQCITPTSGWMFNPVAGHVEAQPLPDDQVKAAQSALNAGGDLFKYKEKGSKIELAGRETVNGVNAYKLKLENKDGKTIFYFIDPSTYYIIKGETSTKVNGQDITTTSIFSNHTKTDIGLVIPYTTVINNQGVKSTITVKKVEHNKDIDPKIFEMPK